MEAAEEEAPCGEATRRAEETSAEALRAAEDSKRVVREATEASVKAARDNVMASSKVLQEAIAKAEETTKSARKAARTAMRVFEEAAAGSEKVAQETEETEEAPRRQFVDAMSRLDAEETKARPQPRDSKPDIHSRLQFPAKMYATTRAPFTRATPSTKSSTPRLQ
jgi:triphosphoribosyl-dephospho-CoA synthetase